MNTAFEKDTNIFTKLAYKNGYVTGDSSRNNDFSYSVKSFSDVHLIK